jgi:uracil-DNA glycosylase family 4
MEHIGTGFVPFEPKPGHVMMIGEAPGEEEAKSGKCFSGGSGSWLRNMARIAGHNWDEVTLTNTILCQPPANIYPTDPKCTYLSREGARTAVEHCARVHLWPNIQAAGKEKIFAIGNQSLRALTGKSGISTWRGSALPLLGGTTSKVIPTIHPAALMRQAKLTSVVIKDLRKGLTLPPEHYNLAPSIEDVARFQSTTFAFDLEWDKDSKVTICGLADRFYQSIVVPWREPFLTELRRIFENAQALIGHNIIGADLEYIERMGWVLRPDIRIEDTMLKQHLVQPDFPHDLAFVASIFTNKVFWKGKGWSELEEGEEAETISGQQWRTWDRADALPRALGGYGGCTTALEAFALYNARDVDAEFQVNTGVDNMIRQYDLRGLYEHCSRPLGYICRWMGAHGLKLDTTRLREVREVVDIKVADLEQRLPEGLRPFERTVGCNLPAPPGTYRAKIKKCKGAKSEGTSHPVCEIIFDSPGELPCPVCAKSISSGGLSPAKIIKGTKQELVRPYNSSQVIQKYCEGLKVRVIVDRKTGQPTTGKKARNVWAKDHPEFVTLGALKQQVTLRNNFAKDSLQGQERMYFNLLVHGTAEARLSSSGKRRGIDLNIQNQPKKFRAIYIPDFPDWSFVNLDIVQGENWLTAWIAQDWARWERLQDPTFDEHSDLAMAIFNRPISKELADKDDEIDAFRQIGKKINHGRNYLMGVKTQHEALVSEGFDHFSQADVKEFIKIWEKKNAGTAQWQKEIVETAKKQGYLRNAFGRYRWFSSRSTATEACAFLPASTLAEMVLRMMIAHYPGKFMDSIIYNKTEVFHEMVPEWIMSFQVHDSLVPQGPDGSWLEQARRSKAIMEQPFPQLGGFHFKVEVKKAPAGEPWANVHTVEV